MAFVRFDDLTPGREHAFELDGLDDVIVADEPGQVRSALRAVDHAVRHGAWAAGYVSYEAAPGLDPAVVTQSPPPELPCVWFGIFRRRQSAPSVGPRLVRPAPYNISAWRSEVDAAEHAAAVDAIRTHIRDGDTYQVNYTFRLRAAFSGDPFELYRDIVVAQRGAFGAYLDTGRHHVVSASPELFFTRHGRQVESRPMKGTIGRGRWLAEDEMLAAYLTGSSKERAENLMTVDVVRNDIGRIAEYGSVEVGQLFALERYETLWQLTSRIGGRLRPNVGLVDVFRALFPAASVTGAPKTRVSEVVATLERSPRGVYCGAVGYLEPHRRGRPGRASFNVAIRTVTIDTREGTAEYGVGGGITWDSLSSSEFEEARVKAQLLGERRPEFSLVETLRWDPGSGYVLRDEHIERLTAAAAFFGFTCRGIEVVEALDEVVFGAEESQRVRLVLRRDGEIDVSAVALPVPMCEQLDVDAEPIRFAIDEEPIPVANVFLFHKTTRREIYDQRLKRYPSADDVLMVNAQGEVSGFTIGNVAVRDGDTWWTPPIASGVLGGVFRGALVERGVLKERPILVDELAEADEIVFLNSVRGWRRAVPVAGGAEVITAAFPGDGDVR
jgi:para-aminobenzoate synthetase/4-amino-4-deoxychorismate lyase